MYGIRTLPFDRGGICHKPKWERTGELRGEMRVKRKVQIQASPEDLLQK